MYFCLDCGSLFETPKKYIETHGLDTPPYEEWVGCPDCGGDYTQTEQCHLCGEWITGEYIILRGDTFICEDCYHVKNIEDGV
jgi:hypothetical protein